MPLTTTPVSQATCGARTDHHWRPCLFTLLIVAGSLGGLVYAVANWEWPAGAAQGSQFEGRSKQHATLPRRFRIGTFNIHGGYGADGSLNLERTAEVLRGMDFVGLNEVHGGGRDPRSQVEQLAARLDLNWLFAPTETSWSGPHFGQGVLSRLPVSGWKRIPFVRQQGNGYRNYVEVEIPLNGTGASTVPSSPGQPAGTHLTILITHLDRKADRQDQLGVIIQRFLELPPPVILMGDLNAKRTEPQLVKLMATPGVTDCFGQYAAGDFVRKRIDWMFTRGLNCIQAHLEPTSSSDHPWGWTELELLTTRP